MRMREKWILVLVVVILGCAGTFPVAGQECARLTDGYRSLALPLASVPQGPTCREPAPMSVSRLEPGTEEPGNEEPVPGDGMCNCDTNSDCKEICGDRGGYCGIFLACPIPPYKHVGTCFCTQQVGSNHLQTSSAGSWPVP